MRSKHIPSRESSAVRIVLGFAAAVAVLIVIAVLTNCSPRAFDSVNKLAPDPPYAGERHGGMDRAQYLRVEEPLE